MILTLTPNASVDKTIFYDAIELGGRLRSDKCECVPGGKGCNVSRAVRTMGHSTRPMVIVGGHAGAHIIEMIQQQDRNKPVPVWVEATTRTITTILEEKAHRQTAYFEPGPAVTEKEYQEVKDTFAKVVRQAKIVTFNGTVPDPAIESLYKDLLPIAHEAGATVFLDSHGREFALALEGDSKPYLVKPNLEEAAEYIGHALDRREAQWKAVDAFHERGVAMVVLSLGAEGALISRDGQQFLATPPAIEEINAVGSGDALLAGFAIGIQYDRPLEETAALAVAMGAANASSWDIGHFTPEEVRTLQAQVTIRER